MKDETLIVLTDPHPSKKSLLLRRTAEIIILNAGYEVQPENTRDRAWAAMVALQKWGFDTFCTCSLKSMGRWINTVAELVAYMQQ